MPRAAILFLCVAGAGCEQFGTGQNARIPGDLLGGYHVIAQLETSTCGPGALGSSDLWEFDIRLSRDDRDLYWLNGREAIVGDIAADGVSFLFDTRVAVELSESKPGRPGCLINRIDQASGTLSSAVEVTHFSGRMRFGYFAAPGSDCAAIVGMAGGLAELPCDIQYRMQATRTATRAELEQKL